MPAPAPRRPARAAAVACLLLAAAASTAARADALPAAVFPFGLYDTSPDAGSAAAQADLARLPRLDAQLRALLAQDGRLRPIDTAAAAAAASGQNLRSCGGCDVDFAARVGARASVTAWVQKVSQLILNITVVVRAVPGGQVLHAASVDIRGDTDESFTRGLAYLVANRLFQ